MAADDRGVAIGRGGTAVEFFKPLMWSAIVGGTVAALGVQIILTLLGVGLGMAMVDPIRDNDPANALGIGAVVWLLVTGVVAYGLGGWVAGHMSGVLRTGSGAMHGFAAWALAACIGAAVTALAGAPVLGGAAAPAAHARYADATSAGSSSSNQVTGTSTTSGAVADTISNAVGTNRTATTAGRQMTEAEVRQAADDARRATAKASLWTGVAFLVALISACVGGTLGRKSPQTLVEGRRDTGNFRGAQPAM
jgi:hypothetical protein